jgi:Protein of unknown function (DUF2846).
MKIVSMFLAASILAAVATLAFAQTSPSTQAVAPGCGDKKIKWDVRTDRSKHPIAKPETGKALVYFLQDDANFQSKPAPTTRFGLNGAWVGATQSNAYFYVAIDPGEQHLCAGWQSWVSLATGHTSAADHFTAEAGKSCFFIVRDYYVNHEHGPASMKLEPINSDEAELLMTKFGFSTSQARK